jgi:hypothetical protein
VNGDLRTPHGPRRSSGTRAISSRVLSKLGPPNERKRSGAAASISGRSAAPAIAEVGNLGGEAAVSPSFCGAAVPRAKLLLQGRCIRFGFEARSERSCLPGLDSAGAYAAPPQQDCLGANPPDAVASRAECWRDATLAGLFP